MSCGVHPRWTGCVMVMGANYRLDAYANDQGQQMSLACLRYAAPTMSLVSPLCPVHWDLAIWGDPQDYPDGQGGGWREIVGWRGLAPDLPTTGPVPPEDVLRDTEPLHQRVVRGGENGRDT